MLKEAKTTVSVPAVNETASHQQPHAYELATVLAQQPRHSRVLTTQSHLNALMAAATPLLGCLGKLSQFQLTEIYDLLSHEMEAFSYRAQVLGYRADSMLVARYLLCAVLDEEILKLHEMHHDQFPFQTLLAKFHDDDGGSEGFFLILQRLMCDPKTHLDTLELCYVCLTQRFQGKFRHLAEADKHLYQLLGQLYQLIMEHRGEPVRALSTFTIQTSDKTPPLKRRLLQQTGLAIAFSAVISTCFYAALMMMVQPLQQQIAQVLQPLLTS